MIEIVEFVSVIAWAVILYSSHDHYFSPLEFIVSLLGFACSIYLAFMSAKHRRELKNRQDRYLTFTFEKDSGTVITREAAFVSRFQSYVEEHDIKDQDYFALQCLNAGLDVMERRENN